MAAQYPQVGERIRGDGSISKETESDLRRGIDAFKQQFASRRPAAKPAPAATR
jgi:hypothetical protein